MKKYLLALAALLFCAAWGSALDLAEVEARLAAQDAQLANQNDIIQDLRAKLDSGASSGEAPEAITSIQKNAKVTVGGQVNTRYSFTSAKQNNNIAALTGEPIPPHTKARVADLTISDAYLNVQIDVNDYFDAYLSLDLHKSNDENDYGLPESYYVRWKNLCNTGFGIKVGRDALVFGAEGVGELGSYAAGSGDGYYENLEWDELPHNGWDVSGVTQITPYWEGLDGKLTWELSLMQNVYDDSAYYSGFAPGAFFYNYDGSKLRSRNYGVGTFSTRVAYTPVEDLTLTLSLANYHSNGIPDMDPDMSLGYPSDPTYVDTYDSAANRKNNTVYGFAFNYRPSGLKKLAFWGQWIHGRNVEFKKGWKSHAFNLGVSYDFRDDLTLFVQGDYLHGKYAAAGSSITAIAKSIYGGLQYSLPYGVTFEAGWKHEWTRWSFPAFGGKIKGSADTIYGVLGFEF
ncbi:MAG: hypothetical protein LBU23_08465 [Planctomycetota bacterium]|jgi:hypothetical protein|nr:hypothetical protein [Planctomycetota bacterium]